MGNKDMILEGGGADFGRPRIRPMLVIELADDTTPIAAENLRSLFGNWIRKYHKIETISSIVDVSHLDRHGDGIRRLLASLEGRTGKRDD